MWRQINRALNNPSLGAVPFVQRMEGGRVVDVMETEAMNTEIQVVTEQRFDLSMSAPITVSSLREKLGFPSNTDFARSLLNGEVHVPPDVDNVTTIVIEEIQWLFQTFKGGYSEITLRDDNFCFYWGRFKEKTSSSISGMHAGHYKMVACSAVITNFLSRKITLIARGRCPPDRWGHGLQVMLEKVAEAALVDKLWAILLMEANFNYMNRWVFGHKAINKMYAIGYIPEDQYSQKESTAEDPSMDNCLTMDLSRQLQHPLATMSADVDKCYDHINHIIMSVLLLAIVGTIGNVIAMLHPIQTMKFFQRTAQGDSTTFMGGRGHDNPLQGLCQGNGAAPACWLMLSLVLMHCYKRQGFGLRIMSPISGAIIYFLREIYIDNMDLIITRPKMVPHSDTKVGINSLGLWTVVTVQLKTSFVALWFLAEFLSVHGV